MKLHRDAQPSALRYWTWGFAALLGAVVLVGHLPGVNDSEGRLFGMFHITLYQDVLHGGSALWAAIAAWHSHKQARIFLIWFGTIYFLDGVLGAITGVTYLDFGIFTGKEAVPGPTMRLLVNAPHVAIGGLAMLLGLLDARRNRSPQPT